MDKVRELEARLEEILKNDTPLEEIGALELGNTWRILDGIKNEANEIMLDMLVGATRDEKGRMVSKDKTTFDLKEISQISTGLDIITDKAYDKMHELLMEKNRKFDLIAQKRDMKKILIHARYQNNSLIKTTEIEIESIKRDKQVIADRMKDDEEKGELSSEKKALYERELENKDAIINAKMDSINMLKERNEECNNDLDKIQNDINILMNGGKLEEPSLEQAPAEPERTEEEPTVEPETPEEPERTEGEPEVTPVPFPVGPETPEEPERTEGEPEVTPVPFPVGPETPTEPERTEGEPVVTPVPFPVGPETPAEPERTEGEPEVTPVPFPGGGEELPVEPEEEEPTVEETPEPEQEEEEEEYEPTPAPLPLWKKVTLGLMTAATVFLGAIGVHTGIIAHNQNRMADSLEHIAMVDVDNQEPDQDEDPKNEPDDDKDKDQDQGKNPSSGDKDVNPGSPSTEPTNPGPTNPDPVTPNPEPTNPEPTNPEPTNPEPSNPEPSNPEPSNPEPSNPEPSNPEPSNPDPGQSDYEKENGLPAHLDEGEVIYDESTGISVNDKGETYQENKDGSLSYLGDQNLDKSNSGSSIVGEDELNPSIPQNPPITGEEKTAEEAGLTEGERDSLQDALDGVSGEDALDEKVSNAHSTPATGEDYTQAQNQAELDKQTDADIANFFSNNGIFDALNDGQALMR